MWSMNTTATHVLRAFARLSSLCHLFRRVARQLRDDLLADDGAPGAAVIDLGGGSVQIVYSVAPETLSSISDELQKAYIQELQLPDQRSVWLYQHSYLGFGLFASRGAMLREAEAAGNKDANPCLPHGEDVSYVYADKKYEAHGSGSASGCAALIARMLINNATCGAEAGCSFGGIWGGPGFGHQRVIACSFFFGLLDDSNDARVKGNKQVQVDLSAADYTDLAMKVCKLSAVERHIKFPNLQDDRHVWLCYDLLYLAGLLTEGFGVGISHNVTATGEIDHHGKRYSASWALGLAVASLNAADSVV